MAAKNVIFRKKISNILYDLLPQTSFEQVINGDSKTLDAVVGELTTAIGNCATGSDLTALEGRFNTLVANAPEAYDTLKEISDYITTHTTEYEALLAISGNKVDKVTGKGLSTNDFTNDLKTKLDALYTKAQLDTKFSDVQKAVDANTAAIGVLNGAASVAGSVDNKIEAARSALATNIQKNTTDIAAINNATTGILAQSKTYTNTQVGTKGAVIASTAEPANLGANDLWVYYQE